MIINKKQENIIISIKIYSISVLKSFDVYYINEMYDFISMKWDSHNSSVKCQQVMVITV
jgi:hypothetical protein